MTTIKQYDYLNRLQQISSLPATTISPGAVPISFSYQYITANERTRATFNDGYGHAISYQYDEDSNLTKLTYPDGKTVSYEYNSHNRVHPESLLLEAEAAM